MKILQSNAITEIPENRIRLTTKVYGNVISFFRAKINSPLIHGLLNLHLYRMKTDFF